MLQKDKKNQAGQVLLIAILVIIVSLTIGLSLASRGITNLRTSTEEADSQKALAAAEAEIEKRLQDTTIGTFSGSFSSATFTTKVESREGDRFLINGGSLIMQGDGVDVWFANHNTDGSINYPPPESPQFLHFYWGEPGEEACDSSDRSKWPAALEVIVVSGTLETNVVTTRFAYDLCSSRGNNFISAQGVSSGPLVTGWPNFVIRTPGSGQDLVNVGNVIFMRVIPIYKSTVIGIRACNNGGGQCTDLPSQGVQISSTGKAGTANRRLNVFKGYDQASLPYISYGLFVPTL